MKHYLLLLAAVLVAAPPAAADVQRLDIDWSDAPAAPSAHIIGGDTPATLVRVEIPPNARAVTVTLFEGEQRQIAVPIVPRDADSMPRVDAGPARLSPLGYRYWLLPETSFRGHRIANIAVTPVRASADGRHYRLVRFELEVRTETRGEPAVARRVRHPRTDAADRVALTRMLDAPPLSAATRGVPADTSVAPIEYVIITNDEMAPAFRELADLKTREGMPATVTTVAWILENVDGIDAPARVRSYLRDLYLYHGLRYALLGGDSDQVPVRLARSRFQSAGGTALVSTDMYYACLDGSWNADGDMDIGEAPDVLNGIDGDDVDLVADISVARVPASNAAEAAGFVAKWKSYTGYDPATFRTDYQSRILSLAEVIFPSDWDPSDGPGTIIKDGADFCESTLVYVPETFERTRLYEYADDPDHPTALPETKETVIAEIDDGYGIIDHVGHGFRTNMSVGDGKIENTDADAFANTNAYSLLYGINCTSGAVLFDCIGEHLINNPTGGVVASILSSDLDYPTASDTFKYEFFRLVFREDITRLSDAYHLADLPNVPVATIGENVYRWTIMSLTVFGDPAMEIWRGTPRTLTLDFDPTVEIGVDTVSVTASDAGSPVAGATVCLSTDDAYAVATTGDDGTAVLPFHPHSTGTARVTVTKNTYAPAVDSTTVIAPTGPALAVTSFVLHDGTAEGGFGNGDGVADAGESLLVALTVRNEGVSPTSAGTLTFTLDSPYVTLVDGTEFLPPLAAGAETTLPAAFSVDVTPVLPGELRRVLADASVVAATPEGSWTDSRTLAIRQRILDLVASRLVIVDDDGDGMFEAGETAEITVTLENHGDATAVGVVGLAGTSSTRYVLIDDTAPVGDIPAGGRVESAPLRLLSTGGDETYALDFFASDIHRMAVLGRTLDGVAPPAPDTLVADAAAASIRVIWPPVETSDVRGYRVYRADDATGPFMPVSEIVDAGSYFEDGTVTPLDPYYYRVSTVDWSGNESEMTASVLATTSPPILEGWPVDLPSGLSKGSPTIADLDGDGTTEIVFGWSYPMVLRSNGSDFVDGDADAITTGVFATIGSGLSRFWNSPAVGDIDGDGVLEIVFAAWQTTDPAYLWVLDATGAVEPGWPREIGSQPWSTAAIGDVDGVPGMEIFVSSGAGQSSSPFRGALFGFHHDGSEIIDGDADPTTAGVFYRSASTAARFMYGSPALADLDDDGLDEVVFLEKTSHAVPTASTLYAFDGDGSVLPGFPYGAGELYGSTSSPAIANLDGTGRPEIIVVTEDRVSVVHADGSDASGWPRSLPPVDPLQGNIRDFLSSPAIGDLDGNGTLDVALGWLDGTVHAWNGPSGDALAGFPATLLSGASATDGYLHSPALGNVDGDPDPEILVASGDGRLYAANSDGTPVSGYPLRTASTVNGSIALWDVDGDGNVNLVVQSEAPLLEVFDLAMVPFVESEQPWPMFRHDTRKSGWFEAPVQPPTVRASSSEPTPPAAARVGAPRPNPLRGGTVRIPFDVPRGGADVVVRVFDVSGREARRLADGRFPPGGFELRWDGRTETGRALATGVYIVRVAIGDDVFARKITLVR